MNENPVSPASCRSIRYSYDIVPNFLTLHLFLEFCIEYCVEKSQAFRNRIKDLSEELDELIMASAAKAELDRVKADIKLLNETKLEALRVRSRIKIYEQDEMNTSYFFGRIKSQNEIQSIESVRDEATRRLLLDQLSISILNSIGL